MPVTLCVEEAVQRLKAQYLEMPGTQLTLDDTARLTGLESETCRAILHALEEVRFLRQRHNGVFVRRTSESPDHGDRSAWTDRAISPHRVPDGASPALPVDVSAGAIARRAYELFEARGGQPGHDVEDWLRAEAELRARRATSGR